ncbi:MAG: MATE family efflux transporter, partial [Desulfovibrionaceae bacterium]|nr:MATE family efflux transporter [Desulfovibrionaceae bacterium]
IAFAINVFCDFGLGLGYFGLPNLGYKGIAWATFFSVAAAAVFNMIVLVKLGLLTRRSAVGWRWIRKGAPYMIKISIPTFIMQVFWNLGYIILYMVTATLPKDSINAVAGLTTGLNIEGILYMPGAAFSMTAAIVVGNLLGARKVAEAKKAVARILKAGTILMCSVAVVLWFLAPVITAKVASDQHVAAHALTYLRFNICSTPFTMFSMVLNGCMVGAGATRYNLIANTGSTWLVRLPIAYLFGHVLWQSSTGVFMSMLISQVFLSSTLFYVFKCRNWPRFAMIRGEEQRPAQSNATT